MVSHKSCRESTAVLLTVAFVCYATVTLTSTRRGIIDSPSSIKHHHASSLREAVIAITGVHKQSPAATSTAEAPHATPSMAPNTVTSANAKANVSSTYRRHEWKPHAHHIYSRPPKLKGKCVDSRYLDQDTIAADSSIFGNSGAGPSLFGTKFAQDLIWAHQHPRTERCPTKTKFLMFRAMQMAGTGSQVHILGAWLGIAMNLGRVLLLDPGEKNMYTTGTVNRMSDIPYCGNTTSLECFLQNVSSCTTQDASPWDEAADVDALFPGRPHSQQDVRVLRVYIEHHGTPSVWKEQMKQASEAVRVAVPDIFRELLACSPIHGETRDTNYDLYWWRAQATGFLMRPNRRTSSTLRGIQARRLRLVRGQIIEPAAMTAKGPQLDGCVGVHVRHGDKKKEMKLEQLSKYLKAADSLVSSATAHAQRCMFVGTDDAGVIHEISRLPGWTVMYVDMNRTQDTALHNAHDLKLHGAQIMLDGLLDLSLTLSCSAWVGTLGSNWGRLIDELRSTVLLKADGEFRNIQYYDLGW